MITAPLAYLDDGSIAPPESPPGTQWTAIDVPAGVYRYYEAGDELPQIPIPPPAPSWAVFRLGMLGDPGFRRVVSYGEPIDQASLASEINKNEPDAPNVPALQLLWGLIVSLIPSSTAPTVFEVGSWNAIATEANIPFRFSPEGYLEV
ncbi:hypothetical protein [Leptolyngbya sp. FACHB-16]|uniref:hypothetical protein n=1 Tax=unclassified Leptolyngbya TaxID=2650499 RepID=UPI0016822A32|nr:hypothetical protein [Leptolyngbya sp. FACHB-16]MBD2156235.1 hypothetical protein [Leptolyngbya sp. FACHB-16]